LLNAFVAIVGVHRLSGTVELAGWRQNQLIFASNEDEGHAE